MIQTSTQIHLPHLPRNARAFGQVDQGCREEVRLAGVGDVSLNPSEPMRESRESELRKNVQGGVGWSPNGKEGKKDPANETHEKQKTKGDVEAGADLQGRSQELGSEARRCLRQSGWCVVQRLRGRGTRSWATGRARRPEERQPDGGASEPPLRDTVRSLRTYRKSLDNGPQT